MSTAQTAQERFSERYITSSEIQQELQISRATIMSGRRRGMLPEPIKAPGVRAFIWERDTVMPYINAWRIALASRRGTLK